MSASGAERDQAAIDAEAQNWMLRLRSGDAGFQRAFEDWFAADPAHADAYDRLLAGWHTAGRLPRESQGRPALRPWLIAIAAALLLTIGIGALSLAGLGRSPAAAVELTSRVGEISTHRLPDGSAVTLDTDTRIEATFSDAIRRVRLVQGRARFAVTADARRPFVVAGGDGSARTTAGTMDVALDHDALTIEALSDGVTVQADNASPIALGAREVATLAPASPIAAPALADPDRARWVTGMLSFTNTPLRDVVVAANRYSTTKMVLADEQAAAQRFTGTFRATDVAGLAQMLAAAFHLAPGRNAQGDFVLATVADPAALTRK